MLLSERTDREVHERLSAELAEVESLFAAELVSDLPCVNELTMHIERYRGKMLRPMLVVATAMAGSPTGLRVTPAHRVAAAVMEMVHMATLVHDDVLDDSHVRRNGATVNRLNGNETAVMLGDYLISHAYHLCSGIDRVGTSARQPISRIIAGTTNTVCEGELLQLANRDNWELDEPTYFEIIRRKTASLCGCCCRVAGLLNGADDGVVDELETFGEKVGVAFQIVDDLLDLIGDEQRVGKTLGRDLDKGKLTLPVIRFLEAAGDEQRRRVVSLLSHGAGHGNGNGRAGAARREAEQLLRRGVIEHGGVDYARSAAARLIEQAKSALTPLPASPARRLLAAMADAVLTRQA